MMRRGYRAPLLIIKWTAIVCSIGLALKAVGILPLSWAQQPCHVTKVVDGDTIHCLEYDENVRLAGYDAPETHPSNACGGEAEIALGRAATVAVDERLAAAGYLATLTDVCTSCDRYGRVVARVWVGDVELGAWLVDHGLARVWQTDAEHAAGSNEFWCTNE